MATLTALDLLVMSVVYMTIYCLYCLTSSIQPPTLRGTVNEYQTKGGDALRLGM